MNMNNLKKFIVIISVTILIMLILGLLYDKLEFLDNIVYSFIKEIRTPFLTTFFKFITFFASYYWFIFLIILVFIFHKDRKLTLIMTVYLILVACVTILMKNIFVRIRPVDLMIVFEKGYSFPSGHSSSAMAFYGLVAYLIYKGKYEKWKKVLLISLFITFALLIGFSRIYLGVHYFSDVLAGFMVGIICLMVFVLSNKKVTEKNSKKV